MPYRRAAGTDGCCWIAEPSPLAPPPCFPAARRSARPRTFADCTPLAPVDVDAEPRHPHRRGPAALPRARASSSAPRRSATRAGPQLRPWRRRHHAELGQFEAGDRAGLPGPQRAGRGDRLGRHGPVDRAAGRRKPASRSRSTPPRCRPTRRRTSPAASSIRSAVRRRCGRRPSSRRSSPRALDYSWRRFQIMVGDDYGIRWLPTYANRRQPGGQGDRELPADQPHAGPRRASVPARQRAALRHDVRRDRPLPAADDARRSDRRRQDRGPPLRDARPTSPRCPKRWSSTAPASAAASCSATRSCSPVRGQLAILEPQPEVRYAHSAARLHVPARRRDHPRRHVRARPVGRDARSPATSRGSSRRTSASSTASAAPLEAAGAASNLTRAMNYHRSIPESGGASEMLKDKLTPKAIVAALDEHIVGQDDAKKAVAVALAQPLAPPAAVARAARRGHAQEHPDDRARPAAARPRSAAGWRSSPTRRSSRSRRPSSPRSAMSAATSSRSPATWSRKRSGSSASGGARKVRAGAEDAAMDRLLDALTGKGSSEATRQSFRQRFADGSLDSAEVEIEVDEAPAHAVRDPRHGRAGVRPEVDDGQGSAARARASAASSRCPTRSRG